jgi:hypothetical protein
MEFIIRLTYYSSFLITGILNLFYLYSGIFNRSVDPSTIWMKRIIALTTFPAAYLLYKAYQYGEIEGNFYKGLLLIAMVWGLWALAIGISFILYRMKG